MRNPSDIAVSTEGSLASSSNPEAVSRILLPDEEKKDFEAIEQVIFAELAPTTYFERRLVLSIVHIEWTIDRHRRLIASTLQSAFKEKAADIHSRDRSDDRVEFKRRNQKSLDFAKALNSGDAEERATAEAILEKNNVTRSELTASAYMTQSSMIAYHEARIADLERSRRSLLADYDAIRARKKPAPIIDGEVVG